MAQAKKVVKAAPAARQTASGSKAAQAAAHQGRAAPAAIPAQPKSSANVPAKRQEGAVVDPATLNNLPDFMRQDADLGKGDILMQDLEVPRLKLMQGTSKEIQEYNDLKPGHFFHTTAEEIFSEPFPVVPLYMTRTYLLWRPLESGGGILARADDGIHWSPGEAEFTVKLDKKDGGHEVVWKTAKTVQESGLANWGTLNPDDPNSPPAATLMYNYLLAFPNNPDLLPAVFTFQRSGIKAGRAFNTRIRGNRAAIFGQIYEFRAIEQTNNKNQTFFNVSAVSSGLVEEEEQYLMYKRLHEQFSRTGLNIRNIESLQEEAERDTDHGGDAAGNAPVRI